MSFAVFLSCGGPAPPPQLTADQRETAYRANNQGVALLEQFAYDRAVDAFRQALELDPSLRLAEINLPIALYYAGMNQEAASRAAAAQERYQDAPQPPYMLGLIARAENRPADAVNAFLRVLQIDPDDVGARVNLALEYVQQRKYAEAAALCEQVLAIEPYNATAAYNLGMAWTRAGQREDGLRALERFEQLRDRGYAVTYSQTYLEQGRYAEAVASTGAETELINKETPDVQFNEVPAGTVGQVVAPGGGAQAAAGSALPSPLAGAVALADFDGDADLDVVTVSAGLRFLRNEGAKFADVTAAVGLDPSFGGTGVLVGDYNNDLRPDLFLVGRSGHRLYRQEDQGRFRDVTAESGLSGLPPLGRAAAFLDIDHDGDIDLFFGGFFFGGFAAPAAQSQGWDLLRSGQRVPSRVLRNNGNGAFTDITAATKIQQAGGVLTIGPTDFDNRRDIDLLVVSYGARPQLFRNMRDGSFADIAAAVGLPAGTAFISLALADVNKDGYTDAFLGQESGPGQWALSDGRGRFRILPAPASTRTATAAQMFDYDNDGLLDLFVLTPDGPRLFRNVGTDWIEVTGSTLALMAKRFGAIAIEAAVAGDIDLDGDTDVVTMAAGNIAVWRNESRTGNGSLRVRLTGRVSNRSGIGSKVELRAGSLRQQMETAAATPPTGPADIVFGLGRRQTGDVVRILWPSGVLQAEIDLSGAGARGGLAVLELDRKPSSCPFLFTWNGREFEFVTDFMGGGEMGSWLGPGVRNVPDPDEYVRIESRQLRERDGRFEIRVTNELEETLFADTLRLFAVTHPAGTAVFPDEGLRAMPPAFRLFAARDVRPPVSAVDHHGHDVLADISHLDRRFVDDFEVLPIRGYAKDHFLTLELPPAPSRHTLLLLTGWTDYAFSSDNFAAHQAGWTLTPPAVQVLGADGEWKTVSADVGIPVGRPQTLVVDLAGRFLSASRKVRLVTSMRIYWDRILIAALANEKTIAVAPVPRFAARLGWRGFSSQETPDAKEPYGYDYERLTLDTPWKLMPGRYTREGDVTELIAKTDDRFVISRPGDEIALSFDASKLAPLPSGFTRTFLLYVVGYSKEMNWHSASPDEAAPLPFRGMTRYPYAWPERYPHAEDLDRFHTRVIPRSIPRL